MTGLAEAGGGRLGYDASSSAIGGERSAHSAGEGGLSLATVLSESSGNCRCVEKEEPNRAEQGDAAGSSGLCAATAQGRPTRSLASHVAG